LARNFAAISFWDSGSDSRGLFFVAETAIMDARERKNNFLLPTFGFAPRCLFLDFSMRRRTKLSPEKLAEAQARGREFTAFLAASEARTRQLDEAIKKDDLAGMQAVLDAALALKPDGMDQAMVRDGDGRGALQRALSAKAQQCAKALATPSQARITTQSGHNAFLTACHLGNAEMAAILAPMSDTKATARLDWHDYNGQLHSGRRGAVFLALASGSAATVSEALRVGDFWSEAQSAAESPTSNQRPTLISEALGFCECVVLHGKNHHKAFCATLDPFAAWLVQQTPADEAHMRIRLAALAEARSFLLGQARYSPNGESEQAALHRIAPQFHAAMEREALLAEIQKSARRSASSASFAQNDSANSTPSGADSPTRAPARL